MNFAGATSRPKSFLLLDVVRRPGEPDEHEDDSDVNDVTAVPAATLRDESEQGGPGALPFLHANPYASPELLTDARKHERAGGKRDDGRDRSHPGENFAGGRVVDLRGLDDGRVAEPLAE